MIHILRTLTRLRILALAIAVLAMTAAPARRASAAGIPITLGAQLSTPELFGLVGSFWFAHELTLETRLTLATADLGLSGHIPLSGDWDGGLHTIVVTGLVGYVHHLASPFHQLYNSGLQIEGLAGYGYVSNWELRLLAGVSAAQLSHGWGTAFAAQALVGKVF